jgi:murein DD-endopeptidase MepM/ murein hydrolase activator NlpD
MMKLYLTAALATAATVALVAASPPAGAGPLPGLPSAPAGIPLPSLPSLPVPLPSISTPALPLPTLTPPGTHPVPPPTGAPPPVGGAPGVPPAAGQPAAGGPVQGGGGPESATTVTDPAAVIAGDPGASLYPQLPVEPATTPQAFLVAQLNDVERRVQYLHNVLVRTRADLVQAQAPLGPVAPLITVLTAPVQPSTNASDTPGGRVLALTAAIESGQAELARREAETQSLLRLVNNGFQPLLTTAAVPAPTTSYGGGKLLRPVPGRMTSGFGNRFDPYYHVWQLHTGLDLAAPMGTPIVAAAGGRVTRAGWYGGYGNYTCIDHGVVDGQRLSTCYGHQSALLVTPGQVVSAGQVIGKVGSTGASTGPHVHFEVRLGGRPVDPLPWI